MVYQKNIILNGTAIQHLFSANLCCDGEVDDLQLHKLQVEKFAAIMRLICEIMTNSTEIIEKPSKMTDRITNLHESVLSHILSRLPTKDVIRTCILSRDWEYKWTFSDNVDMCDSDWDPNLRAAMFSRSMDRIVALSRGIKYFHLTCGDYYDLPDVQRWISTALGHNLESVEVLCDVQGTVYPGNLLSRTSLRELILQNCSILDVSTEILGPNLQTLHLYNVEIMKENGSTGALTLTFPVLESFSASGCKWLNLTSVNLNAPLLTSFKFETDDPYEEDDVCVLLVAPELVTFTCFFGLQEIFVQGGSSVISAYLYCDDDRDNPQLAIHNGSRIRQLLNKFTNLEELALSCSMVEVPVLGQQLRCHNKLRQLRLTDPTDARGLLEFLYAAPSLKSLSISVFDWPDFDYGALESIPSCIICHLEEVEFLTFDCEKTQFDLAEFLLKNGKQLKKFSIDTDSPTGTYPGIKEHIMAFPRASSCLTINIDGDECLAIDLVSNE